MRNVTEARCESTVSETHGRRVPRPTKEDRMKLKRTEGFTLIELMIVVAIIGILAVIAIPNFLKFQCKSKQSEAKTNLSGIFTAEKTFFGEYNTFTTDLIAMGWHPDGQPAYAYGFGVAGGAPLSGVLTDYNTARMNTWHSLVYADAQSPALPRFSTARMVDTAGAPHSGGGGGSVSACLNSACANNSKTCIVSPLSNYYGFAAGAYADIDTDPAVLCADFDQWNINGQKDVHNRSNDCSI